MLHQLALVFGLAASLVSASSTSPAVGLLSGPAGGAADNLRRTLARRRISRHNRRAGPSTTPVVKSTLIASSSFVLCPLVTGQSFYYSYIEPADTASLPMLYCMCVELNESAPLTARRYTTDDPAGDNVQTSTSCYYSRSGTKYTGISNDNCTAQRDNCFVSCPNSSAAGTLRPNTSGDNYAQTYPAGNFAVTVCTYEDDSSQTTQCTFNQTDGTPYADDQGSNDASCPSSATESVPGRCLPSIGGLSA